MVQRTHRYGGRVLPGLCTVGSRCQRQPHLKALISVVCAGSAFVDLPRRGGSFTSGMLAWAFAVSQKTFHPELMERDDWEKVLNIRP